MPTPVLAKRPRNETAPAEAETLRFHSGCTAGCFDLLFGTAKNPTRLCREWLRFFRLPEQDCAAFLTNGVVSCMTHDLGKANTGFAGLLKGRQVQTMRHEHVSGLLLSLPELRQWLQRIPGLVFDCVTCAVIGHHLQADRTMFGQPSADMKVFRVLRDGLREVLAPLGPRFSLTEPPMATVPEVWRFDDDSGIFCAHSHAEEVRNRLERLAKTWRAVSDEYRMVMAVRAGLVVADAAASGLIREGRSPRAWLDAAFAEDLVLDGEAVENRVIGPRTTQIARDKGAFSWGQFQDAAEGLPERTLMLQPCGSGKTLAAWRWIKGRATRKPISRVIFLHPTRGTATEGFKDYVSWAPEADAALVQGTAAFDLQGVLENFREKGDPRRGKDFTTEDRLFALTFWQRRIFSATVDQFLGFMQNQYRSICLLPLLVDSVVVVDEVHSFDRNLFSSLKAFLRTFDVPVLCMTASLTESRRQDLASCGLTVFPEDGQMFDDLAARARMPRYLVRRLPDAESADREAVEAVAAGKRVLWVVNTVDRCQELARKHHALCYHSRFKLDDRQKRHRAVVDAFQPGNQSGGVLAVTTQVCEMSLDLDADVLISEAAPITSMIQRLGRCNRHAKPDDSRLGHAFFYQPESHAPYRKEQMANVEDFIAAVDGQTISQARLEELLEQYGPVEYEPERYVAFINDGPWALTRELRDANDFAESAVLDSDLPRYLELRSSHQPTDGLLLSVPKGFTVPEARLPHGIGLTPAVNYNPLYGFFKQPVEAEV